MSEVPIRTLCLGEALIDLVGESRGVPLTETARFSPHFGGAAANVAVVAAQAGAAVSLAGGAGDDAWGRWLLARLRSAGVDVSLFDLVAGMQTAVAFVTVDAAGQPSYELHGDGARTVAAALDGRLEAQVRASAALFISTNTLAGKDERDVTMRARELMLELGRPIVFDVNLRLHRWSSLQDAAAKANACVSGALLVRANASEACAMTDEAEPERAAAAIVQAGGAGPRRLCRGRCGGGVTRGSPGGRAGMRTVGRG